MGPLRLRRVVAAPLALVLLAAVLIAVPFANHARCDAWWSPSLQSPLVRIDDECVGVSDNPVRDFVPQSTLDDGTHQALNDVYTKIMAANVEAASKPDVVTVVFLSVLTPRKANSYASLVEELRGVWVAQTSSPTPIKVVFANGGEGPNGEGMASGAIAADKIIDLAADDPHVVAVTGLSISTDGAKAAIERLGDHALPIIGELTSADDMAEINAYYYQIGPNNRREARVAAFHAQRSGIADVMIVYSGDPADRYSQNLAEDAKQEFANRGIKVGQYQKYRVNNDKEGLPPDSLGRAACSDKKGYAVFYAGRAQHMDQFLTGMNTACQGNPPPVIAGDSASRFILDGKMAQFPNVRLDYVSFANPAAWADCATVPFYKVYFNAFGGACQKLADGRSAAGHDAIRIIAEGVGQVRQLNREAPVQPGLLAAISNIQRDRSINIATGTISFGPNSNVPINKAILILRGNTDKTSTPLLLCGDLPFKLAQGLEKPQDCPDDPK
ncbi:ABC transporter substrate-binding protein [Kibdelosporangium lantanae]